MYVYYQCDFNAIKLIIMLVYYFLVIISILNFKKYIFFKISLPTFLFVYIKVEKLDMGRGKPTTKIPVYNPVRMHTTLYQH